MNKDIINNLLKKNLINNKKKILERKKKQKLYIKIIRSRIYPIPLTLFQTYDNDKEKKYKINRRKWNKILWLKRKFYTDIDIIKYINKNAPLYEKFFNKLQNNKEKAYFFKYIILYYEGGLFCNMDIILSNKINLLKIFEYSLILIKDKINYKNNYKKIIRDDIIFSIKKHPLIYKFLLFIMKNYNPNKSIEVNFGFKILSYFIKKYSSKFNINYIKFQNIIQNNN